MQFSFLAIICLGFVVAAPSVSSAQSRTDDANDCHEACPPSRTATRLATPDAVAGRVMQGLTYVPETREWYYLLGAGKDWKDRSNTMVRSDAQGKIIDYSADESLTLGHGQDLKHLNWEGNLTFISQNREGNGMTAFIYPRQRGGKLANKRSFTLSPAGKNRHTTIGLSEDKKFVVAAYTHPQDRKSYVRVFGAEQLLSGVEGDRSGEAVNEFCLSDNQAYDGSTSAGQHLQAVTMDDEFIYVLNGSWPIEVPKHIYAFRRADGVLVAKSRVEAGKDIALHAGKGTTYEPEGLEWIRTPDDQPLLLMGMRTGGGPGNVNWAVTLGRAEEIFGNSIKRVAD